MVGYLGSRDYESEWRRSIDPVGPEVGSNWRVRSPDGRGIRASWRFSHSADARPPVSLLFFSLSAFIELPAPSLNSRALHAALAREAEEARPVSFLSRSLERLRMPRPSRGFRETIPRGSSNPEASASSCRTTVPPLLCGHFRFQRFPEDTDFTRPPVRNE